MLWLSGSSIHQQNSHSKSLVGGSHRYARPCNIDGNVSAILSVKCLRCPIAHKCRQCYMGPRAVRYPGQTSINIPKTTPRCFTGVCGVWCLGCCDLVYRFLQLNDLCYFWKRSSWGTIKNIGSQCIAIYLGVTSHCLFTTGVISRGILPWICLCPSKRQTVPLH